MFEWTANNIAGALVAQTFNRDVVAICPNCIWTGYECDLLIVRRDLRLIDIEIKISRADLKKDASKDKWWKHYTYHGPGKGTDYHKPPLPRAWPAKVWKHYYALPAAIWNDSLLEFLPSQNSGIILMHEGDHNGPWMQVKRPAKVCKEAGKISAEQAIDIARLVNLRYWKVCDQLAAAKKKVEHAGRLEDIIINNQ